MVHRFTDSISYSINGWLLSGWVLIKHPSYARSCAESRGYNNQQGRESCLGDLENGKAVRNPERRSFFWNLLTYLPSDENIQSGHPTRLKRSSAPCSVPSAVAVPLPHCARLVSTTSTHWRRATAHPRRQQYSITNLHGGLGWGRRHLPAAFSAFRSLSLPHPAAAKSWAKHFQWHEPALT